MIEIKRIDVDRGMTFIIPKRRPSKNEKIKLSREHGIDFSRGRFVVYKEIDHAEAARILAGGEPRDVGTHDRESQNDPENVFNAVIQKADELRSEVVVIDPAEEAVKREGAMLFPSKPISLRITAQLKMIKKEEFTYLEHITGLTSIEMKTITYDVMEEVANAFGDGELPVTLASVKNSSVIRILLFCHTQDGRQLRERDVNMVFALGLKESHARSQIGLALRDWYEKRTGTAIPWGGA